jgi:hypothetical protein
MWMQRLTLSVIFILIVSGCATTAYNPRPLEEVSFKDRAQTQHDGGIRVTAAVLSAAESKEVFGLNLYKKGIQPVWLEIENKEKKLLLFLRYGIDPDYFSPLEVAYMHRSGFSKSARSQMDQYFDEHTIEGWIAPGAVRSGFVFTKLKEGTKAFNVDVVGEDHRVRTFTFFIPVPGLRVDHREVDFEALYARDEIVTYDEKGFRKALEELPCCTTNKDGTEQGDPVNFVVIGDGDDVHHAFLRSGWDETETLSSTSTSNKAKSPGSVRRHRYAPVSPLYVFGRPQDAALQTARQTRGQRNQVRLWLAPMQFEGKHVWVGQISRSIGARTKSEKVTHTIDPDVDDTRAYLIQDLLYSQGLLKFGYVKGVGGSSITEPRVNLNGDPYITDGYRAVLWVSSKPIAFKNVEFVEWDNPPEQ